MGTPETKAKKALGNIADVTVAEWDQQLVALAHEWTYAYANRQLRASIEGNSTPPPAPPRVVPEPLPPASAAVNDVKHPPRGNGPSTIAELVESYRNDNRSGFHALRYKTRTYYENQLRRIRNECGDLKLADLTSDSIVSLYETWASDGKTAMGHSLVTILRLLVNYGATTLEDQECERLAGAVKRIKPKPYAPRKVFISAEQAAAIRAEAHRQGKHSIALAQALQFDCKLRQKDVVGEWVPLAEPGSSDVIREDREKWITGIRWSQINDNLILTHVASLNQKHIVIDLKKAPMVMEELRQYYDPRPRSGPMIVSETTGAPWVTNEFRRWWRKIARACKIPDDVHNADTAMTEGKMASETGASEAM